MLALPTLLSQLWNSQLEVVSSHYSSSTNTSDAKTNLKTILARQPFTTSGPIAYQNNHTPDFCQIMEFRQGSYMLSSNK
jgi:hypothetical protein